jgi:uncharacterized membrane protein YsdA (DUF1294 family)
MRAPNLLQKQPLSFTQLSLLAGCLVLPTLAAIKAAKMFDWRLVFLYAVLISALTYFVCASDKRKAQKAAWRTPESTLHFLELLGGWPGSFIAQRRFRHKTSKLSYQIAFWLIVILHQGVSLDYFHGWKYSLGIASSLLDEQAEQGGAGDLGDAAR